MMALYYDDQEPTERKLPAARCRGGVCQAASPFSAAPGKITVPDGASSPLSGHEAAGYEPEYRTIMTRVLTCSIGTGSLGGGAAAHARAHRDCSRPPA